MKTPPRDNGCDRQIKSCFLHHTLSEMTHAFKVSLARSQPIMGFPETVQIDSQPANPGIDKGIQKARMVIQSVAVRLDGNASEAQCSKPVDDAWQVIAEQRFAPSYRDQLKRGGAVMRCDRLKYADDLAFSQLAIVAR